MEKTNRPVKIENAIFHQKPKLVVGIGASAGGLEVCKRFFSSIPENSGMAFVVIMHLSPDQKSHLAEILKSVTSLNVYQVDRKMELKPNCVYVIAPSSLLLIKDGTINPSKSHRKHSEFKAIDELFISLATDQKKRAVGIIFSGAGDDGTIGIREIKKQGGLCLAQDPDDAQHSSMPKSAIATELIDEILTPEEMPNLLLEYEKNPTKIINRTHIHYQPGFAGILELLEKTYGLNFNDDYKSGTLVRRTERRMARKHLTDWQQYLSLLESDPNEISELYGDLLIGVTRFFRDSEVWKELQKKIIPSLLKRYKPDNPLKIWIAGCATGEEVYGLGMLFCEQFELLGMAPNLQIFATDVSESALIFARTGIYPQSIREEISSAMLSQFFTKKGDSYEVQRKLRKLITFSVHNLHADPPFSKLDFISCRNVLIYFKTFAQHKILEMFYFALNPEGFLLLGSSETVGQRANLFETVSQKTHLYRPICTTEAKRYHHLNWIVERSAPTNWMAKSLVSANDGPKIGRVIEQLILSRFTWACVVITEALEIQSFFGPTHDYLVQPTGEARLDLLSWVKPGMYPSMRAALEKVRKTDEHLTIRDIHIERENQSISVEYTIEPILLSHNTGKMFLVTFRDLVNTSLPITDKSSPSQKPLVRQLEAELKSTRNELQSTIEQLEITNEEYRAGHEEMLSLNEELQSNNEELEATKEELQSLNEELVTVNQQINEKNIELRETGSDLNNILVSSEIPIIFLNLNLEIRRFTPISKQLMCILPTDVGRSIDHIKERFINGNLIADCKKVLEKLVPISVEVKTLDGRFYTRKILPYRSEDNQIDGLCITFLDITEQKYAEEISKEERLFSESIISTVRTSLIVLDDDLKVVKVNSYFYELFKITPHETEDVLFFDIGNHLWDIPNLRLLLVDLLRGKEEVHDFEVKQHFPQLGERTMLLNAYRLKSGQLSLILLSIEDITQRNAVEQLSHEHEVSLVQEHKRKDEFLAMLGHELRNPFAALKHGIDLLESTKNKQPDFEKIRSMMLRQANRISIILDQLLEVARISVGNFEMAHENVDLVEVIRTAVEAVTPLMNAHKHILTISFPSEGTVFIRGDANRLTQVVENPLANAAHYTKDGGKIGLFLETNKEWIQIRVKDNGIGIDSELIPHLFGLFTQGPRTLARTEGGLGLGLSLVKLLVELHRGTVHVNSSGPNCGSEFVVKLPMDQTLQAVGKASKKRANHHIVAKTMNSYRFLIVEDNLDLANLLDLLLETNGHVVQVVHNGPAALKVFSTFRPDVILLDLGLPDMDGYQVAKLLRKEQSDNSFLLIAMTGYQSDSKKLKEAGFDEHLIKPINMQKITSLISDWEHKSSSTP